jgi:hypothetical protein
MKWRLLKKEGKIRRAFVLDIDRHFSDGPLVAYRLADAVGRPLASTGSGGDWAFIKEQNLQAPTGKVGGAPTPPDQEFTETVSAPGRLVTVEEFENTDVRCQMINRLESDGDVINRKITQQPRVGPNRGLRRVTPELSLTYVR